MAGGGVCHQDGESMTQLSQQWELEALGFPSWTAEDGITTKAYFQEPPSASQVPPPKGSTAVQYANHEPVGNISPSYPNIIYELWQFESPFASFCTFILFYFLLI